jgi:DNA polymerase-1
MLANDTKMAELFNSGHDFHLATARMVAPTAWKVTNWDALSDELKKKYRAQAKNMNFQINYDVEPEYKLAKTVGCSLDEARRFVALVFGQFHSLRKAIDKTVALAKRHGGVFVFVDWEPANWRDLPALGESASQENKGRIRNAINSSWNTTVQGSAAHLVTRALEPVQLAFDEAGIDGHVLLTVYDSILAEVREGQVDEAREIMERIMTQWPTRAGVPLKVDTKIGHNWGSMEKV